MKEIQERVWKKTFMEIALKISERSTCIKTQVGAIIVRDNRIISLGYNGVPSGQVHCEDMYNSYYLRYTAKFEEVKDMTLEEYLSIENIKKDHIEFAVANEIHAEMNAILFAAKNGVSTDNAIIYTTHSPCSNCAKAILQAGIREVYYNNEYRIKDGIKFLLNNEIICEKVEL